MGVDGVVCGVDGVVCTPSTPECVLVCGGCGGGGGGGCGGCGCWLRRCFCWRSAVRIRYKVCRRYKE